MKFLILVLVFIFEVRGSELAFEVVDEIRSGTSRERQMELLLDSYDAFSAVVRDRRYRWQDSQGRHDVAVADARLICDVPAKTLKIELTRETDAKRLDAIAHALQVAVHAKATKRMKEAVERLTAKIAGLKSAADSESDPTRRRILWDAINACIPPLDPPPGPGVRLQRKNG